MSDKINSENPETKIKEGHVYDGIYEEDNPLPTWWLITFLGTIIFAGLYFLHYQFGGGPTLQDELKVAMGEIEQHQAQVPVLLETEDGLKSAMAGGDNLKLGATLFESKCSACHGKELQGLIGPNLTDDYWLHGKGTRLDIAKVIREGVLDKGMPPWGALLKKEEVYALIAFIHSRHDSHPAGAKAPQGEKVEE